MVRRRRRCRRFRSRLRPQTLRRSISGAPATTATVGTQYTFTPTASDANGDTLTFSITNKPAWATFTASNGRLQGTPAAANVGTAANIMISVTDGKATTQLAAFSIVVSGAANRAPTISGTPATAVMTGTQYSFQPTANDPDSDTLTFSIVNKPVVGDVQRVVGPSARNADRRRRRYDERHRHQRERRQGDYRDRARRVQPNGSGRRDRIRDADVDAAHAEHRRFARSRTSRATRSTGAPPRAPTRTRSPSTIRD